MESNAVSSNNSMPAKSENKNLPVILGIGVGAIVLIIAGILLLNNGNMMQDTTSSVVTVGGATMSQDRDLVENASEADNLSTLVAAVQAAGLVDALKASGPFTLFAPSDEAFSNLPEGTLDSLLQPENVQQLTDILTYHVVSGRYLSSDLSDGMMLTTLNGKQVRVSMSGSSVMVNDSNVEIANAVSSNGVFHVIDTVLIPRDGVMVGDVLLTPESDIVENASMVSALSTLVEAVQAANLVETLQSSGPFTVFAPNNDAFAKLPDGTLEDLLLEQNMSQLAGILTYHVVPGLYSSEDLVDGTVLTTVNGQQLSITVQNGMIYVNDSRVLIEDIVSSNGNVFVIDTVLLP